MDVANRLARLFLVTLVIAAMASVDIDRPGVGADSEDAIDEEPLDSKLRPGDNFAGWIGEPLPLTELFERFPQIESITAWDAPAQREISASPQQAVEDRALRTLEPGTAYVIRVGGEKAIDWVQPLEPAARNLQLRAGDNWVAWMGPDDWLLEDVASGLGVSLETIDVDGHVYDPSSDESSSAWPRVMRGDALKVTVNRDVIWLQPTFVMPAVHYVGNVPHSTRRLVERDLTATLAYSATTLGVQADPSTLIVVVANSAKAAFDKAAELGRQQDWDAFRNRWQRVGGWYSSSQDAFYLKASSWEGRHGGRYPWGRYTLLHEYIHALQYQLVGDATAWYPNWLLEGTAEWFEADLSTVDRNGYPLSRVLINALNQAAKGPPLEEIESSNSTWQYSFGLVAVDLLVDRVGESGVLNFYRALAPGRAGPDGRWETRPTVRSAFQAAFGLTLDQFYEEFEALMAKRRGSARRRPASNEVVLAGTIVNSDGTPRVGATLVATAFKDGHPAGWDRRAKSGDDGAFELFVRKRSEYRIRIELDTDWPCRFWWSDDSDDRWPTDQEANPIEIGGVEPEPITIAVDADRCRWQLSGHLLGADQEPLGGILITARSEDARLTARTESDGRFEIATRSPATYTLHVDLGGCIISWRNDGRARIGEDASPVEVVNSSILGIRFEIPERTCLWFDGVLLNAGGAGIADVNVYAQKDSGRVWSRTDTAGAFQLPVTETADYYLYSFPDGCRVYYRPDGATGRRSERSLVTTSDDQAVDLTFRLPVDMCTRRIEGQLLNADGLGMSGHYVAATGTSGYGSDRSDDEGVFSFAVPAAGSYRLSVTVDGCQLFYAAVGGVTDSDNARVVQVGSSDVSGIRFHLPDDSAALCSS